MPKRTSSYTTQILQIVKQEGKISIYTFIKTHFKNESYKKVYTHIYQLEKRGYLEKYTHKDQQLIKLSSKGEATLSGLTRERSEKWQMIIFDIPETQRPVRDYLRSKIRQLGFKKWQNSIWVSPYKLPSDVESELKQLSDKFFIRLLSIATINNDSDIKALFKDEKIG